jgi:predicted nucleic acid-binding Zn ribbon protein
MLTPRVSMLIKEFMTYGNPHRIGDVLAELMARRGYARERSAGACAQAWREAAGPSVAECSRATQIRRGVLEVLVTHSTLVQEIVYQKAELIKKLAVLLPQENIRDLKLRVGPLQ